MSAILILEAIAFLDLLAVSLIIPLVPLHISELGGTHITNGLMGSIYAWFQLGSGPLIGSLSDLKGRKNVLIVTLVFCGVLYSAMGLTTSIGLIMVIRGLLGLFKQTQILTKALVADYEPNKTKHSAAYGKLAAISGIGITLGPVIGGHVMEYNPNSGFTVVSILVFACFMLNAGLAWSLPRVLKRRVSRKCENHTSYMSNNLLTVLYGNFKMSVLQLYEIEWSLYWDVLLFKMLLGFAMGIYYSNYVAYLVNRFDMTPKYIGYIIAFQGVVGSVSSFCIDYINTLYKDDVTHCKRTFHVFLFMLLSLLGLCFANNVIFYVLCLIPLAVCNAVGRLVTLEMILNRSQGEYRGTLIGASNSVRSLSGVVAPMVAGSIAQYIGVQYVVYASIVSTLVGTIASYKVSCDNYSLVKNRIKED